MRIIYGDGFDEEAKRQYIGTIFQNIFDAVQCLIRGMDMLKLNYADGFDMEKVELVKNLDLNTLSNENNVEQNYWTAVEDIWKDAGIQTCYQKSKEFNLGDNTD
jgi:hypothetical protein